VWEDAETISPDYSATDFHSIGAGTRRQTHELSDLRRPEGALPFAAAAGDVAPQATGR